MYTYFVILPVYIGTIYGERNMELYKIHSIDNKTIIHDSGAQSNYQESFVFMDEAEYELFEERAAIIQYEGKLSRNDAEYLAYQRVLQYRKVYAQAS